MILIGLTSAAVIFGYALGYAIAYKEFEAELLKTNQAAKFWQDICTRQRKQIEDTKVKWNPPPPGPSA